MRRFCASPNIAKRQLSHNPRLALIFMLLLALGGCSILYSYNNIDRYIRWSLDDYIHWSDEQDHTLRERLHAQLQWHRVAQLPAYREWLQARLSEVEGEVSVAQWRVAGDQLQNFWRDVMMHATGDISAQLSQLSDKQVHDLLAEMNEKQKELAEKFANETAAEVSERRREKMEKSIKYWIGSVDKKQSDLIKTWAQASPDTRQQRLDSRQRWTDAFAEALSHRHEADIFVPKIQQLFATPQENWGEEYRAIWQSKTEANIELFVNVHNINSAKQRQVERERIEQWLKIIDDLAAE